MGARGYCEKPAGVRQTVIAPYLCGVGDVMIDLPHRAL